MAARTFKYDGYSTGRYGPRNTEGLTLQFVDIETGEPLYCVFNVSLTRDRTTKHGKKGSPLPKGHFRAPARGEFLKFWQRCGLVLPRRTSAIHEYMGNLKSVVLVGEIQRDDKLMKTSIRLAETTDNSRTSDGQATDNSRTRVTDKESTQAQKLRDFGEYSTTCFENYEKKVIRECGNTESSSLQSLPIPQPKRESERPEEQSTDEWLSEYQSAGSL